MGPVCLPMLPTPIRQSHAQTCLSHIRLGTSNWAARCRLVVTLYAMHSHGCNYLPFIDIHWLVVFMLAVQLAEWVVWWSLILPSAPDHKWIPTAHAAAEMPALSCRVINKRLCAEAEFTNWWVVRPYSGHYTGHLDGPSWGLRVSTHIQLCTL